MGFKELSRETIPEWDYGDIGLKNISFGDNLKLGDMLTSVNVKTSEINTKDAEGGELSLYMLAAGINWIKAADGVNLFIKPSMSTEEKKKILYNISTAAGKHLLQEVMKFNNPISEDEKKV